MSENRLDGPAGYDRAATARPRRTAVVPLVVLLSFVVLLAVIAYFPFDWDPPGAVRNDVTRSADGSLHFGEQNRAHTPGTPIWLPVARKSGSVQVHLVVNPTSEALPQASIMMLASDFWHTDFALGQNHSSLLVWLRRPGSTNNGDPPYSVGGVFQAHHWTTVDFVLRGSVLSIAVDGATRTTSPLPADPVRDWTAGQVALGGEVHGGGPWQGQIRHAAVSTPGYAVDYVSPGALSVPARYFYLPDHIAPFPPPTLAEWLILLLHLLSFIPVGFLIVWARTPPVRLLPATLLAAALAVALAAGKFFFHARHMAVADIVVQTTGALLGAWLALLLRRRSPHIQLPWQREGHQGQGHVHASDARTTSARDTADRPMSSRRARA
jgi:VanZ family protein